MASNEGKQHINPASAHAFRDKRHTVPNAEELINGIIAGDRLLLSRAITIVESTLATHQQLARTIVDACLPKSGNAIRIGITGVPGVGKSTFIEAFGKHLTSHGKKVAVLAVDPSSQRSHGSILGDKTRMETLANDPNAYIRPSPTSGSLGGVAKASREAMLLCEAAGFDVIVVETVGVGQSETAVRSMVDFFLLLSLAGAGDELQGIKRGIMEMADAIAINKADGENVTPAKKAQVQLKTALHLFPATDSGWIPRTVLCSALQGTGIEDVWEIISEHNRHLSGKGLLEKQRQQQARDWMQEALRHQLEAAFLQDAAIQKAMPEMEQAVVDRQKSPFTVAAELLAIYQRSDE